MITAQAIRFTDDVPAMRTFLEQLGLVAVVTASDTWAVMRSGAGEVLLHGTANADSPKASGQTELTFDTDQIDALAAEFGVTVIDEAFGRSVRITDPEANELQVNETQTDYYGYTEHDATPDAALSLCPVLFTDPSGPYAAFLTRLGLRAEPGADESFALFAADRGSVGLHVARPGEFEQYLVGDTGVRAHLTFTTTADPNALAERLRAAGHEVLVDTSFGTMLEITDPDGCKVQVHAF